MFQRAEQASDWAQLAVLAPEQSFVTRNRQFFLKSFVPASGQRIPGRTVSARTVCSYSARVGRLARVICRRRKQRLDLLIGERPELSA